MASRNIWAQMKRFRTQGGFSDANPAGSFGRKWYVDTINGVDSNAGSSWDAAFRTMAKAFQVLDSHDQIILSGVVKEQLIGPAGVFDIKIVGAGNRPRQATSSGTPTGGGSCWLPPASPTATTALLKLIEQAWQIENIQFVPHTSSSCITIQREGSVPEKDGSHAIIRGCRLVGGSSSNGVVFKDGGYNCVIEDCEFESLAGTAILSDGTGVDVVTQAKILGNRFSGCTNSIAISSKEGRIIGNVIRQTANDTANKVNLISVSGQGEKNMVLENYFSDATANVTIAKGYKPGTSDVWRNYVTDAADPIITVPA